MLTHVISSNEPFQFEKVLCDTHGYKQMNTGILWPQNCKDVAILKKVFEVIMRLVVQTS